MCELGVSQAASGCSLPYVTVPEGLLAPGLDGSARGGQEVTLF